MLKTMLAILPLLQAAPPAAPTEVTSTEGIPFTVTKEMEYAKERCRIIRGAFTLAEKAIFSTDFNADSKPDYIIDTSKFLCDKDNKMFTNSSGSQLLVYLSGEQGKYTRVFDLNIYRYIVRREYGKPLALDVWVRTTPGYSITFYRYQMKEGKFDIVKKARNVELPDKRTRNPVYNY